MNACCPRTIWTQPTKIHGETRVISHENWICPNWRSSKYFMLINHIYTTACKVHICLQMIVLYTCNVLNGCNINMLWMSCFYTKFYWQHVLHMRVCSVSITITSGHRIIFMLSANVGIKSTSVSAFGLVSSGTLSWAPSATWQADCSKISWFSWNCSTGAAWKRVSSSKADDVGSAQRSSRALQGICLAVVECDISRKVDWTWRAECMASSVVGPNSNGLYPVGTPEGALLRSPSKNYRRSRGSANVLRRVPENAVRSTAVCFEMDEGHFGHLL